LQRNLKTSQLSINDLQRFEKNKQTTVQSTWLYGIFIVCVSIELKNETTVPSTSLHSIARASLHYTCKKEFKKNETMWQRLSYLHLKWKSSLNYSNQCIEVIHLWTKIRIFHLRCVIPGLH